MPNFYVISYDLKQQGQDYTSLYEAIKSFEDWKHPLESMWLIRTQKTADQISDILRREGRMDANDLLFVSKIDTNDKQGWLPKSTWEWFRQYNA